MTHLEVTNIMTLASRYCRKYNKKADPKILDYLHMISLTASAIRCRLTWDMENGRIIRIRAIYGETEYEAEINN